MRTISVDEARARFGELTDPIARSYREFETPEGDWRPMFEDRALSGYRLYPKRVAVKKKRKPYRYSRSPRL